MMRLLPIALSAALLAATPAQADTLTIPLGEQAGSVQQSLPSGAPAGPRYSAPTASRLPAMRQWANRPSPAGITPATASTSNMTT